MANILNVREVSRKITRWTHFIRCKAIMPMCGVLRAFRYKRNTSFSCKTRAYMRLHDFGVKRSNQASGLFYVLAEVFSFKSFVASSSPFL